MSQFRFEKEHASASLVLSTGRTIHGCFFVVASLTTRGGPERVGDLLNTERGFFPFQQDDGTTGQYNRAHVVIVRLPAGRAEEQLEPGYAVSRRRSVAITLSSGATIGGVVLVPESVGHDRLSDWVRNNSKPFWYLVTAEGTVLVNSSHIVEIVEQSA